MLVDKRNVSRITSSRSLNGATFLLAGWRLSHPKELPGDLPVFLECHTLTMNMIVLQLSDAVSDISMLQCSAQFRILIINANFVVYNATHALASSATAKPISTLKRKSSSSGMDGLQRRRRRVKYYYVIMFLTLYKIVTLTTLCYSFISNTRNNNEIHKNVIITFLYFSIVSMHLTYNNF